MIFDSPATRRLQWLLWALLVWVVGIFGRLVSLQVFEHDDLLRQAHQQQQRTVEIPADRGTILDRTGQPLAKSLPVDSVCVNPRRIPDLGVAADLLSRVLDLDRKTLLGRLESARERKSGFLWVKRKLLPDEAKRLRSMNLDWVEFRQEMGRFYPRGTLAAHVLGGIGYVDDEEQGNAGIELAYDEDLAGRAGEAHVFNDVRMNPYDSVVVRKPEPGSNLMLTIDPNLQYISERELDKAVASSGATTGTVVVMDPQTGDILAMASYPRYDPNTNPSKGEPALARSNLAITTPFEPGSVFKVFTLAAALEDTSLRPDTIINCGNGVINLFGRVIHDHGRYSALSMADVLAKSSNIGAIQIGLKVGDQGLYDELRKFGFGRKTGIELPGESSGLVRRVSDWTPSSIGSVAMGHEVSATSLQLALAGAAVANGGMLVKPRLVMARQRLGSPMERIPVEPGTRVIKAQTSIQLRQMMEGVVLHGTGKKAILQGYTSGGKTGSAQIFDLAAHTYTHTYNSSFLGFAPVANPQIVISVTLNGTTHGSAGFGGAVAAPVFHEIATHALRMLDVPQDVPSGTLVSDAKGPDSMNDLPIADLGGDTSMEPQLLANNAAPAKNLHAHGTDSARSRSVSSVTPPPVRDEDRASASELASDRRHFLAQSDGPTVPDFRGMTLRAVLEEAAAENFNVQSSGSGLVRAQDPAPGTPVPAHATIRVQFGK